MRNEYEILNLRSKISQLDAALEAKRNGIQPDTICLVLAALVFLAQNAGMIHLGFFGWAAFVIVAIIYCCNEDDERIRLARELEEARGQLDYLQYSAH